MLSLCPRIISLPIIVIGLVFATISLNCYCVRADPDAVYLVDLPSVSGAAGHVRTNLQMLGATYSKSLESFDYNDGWQQTADSSFLSYNWQWRSVYNLNGQYARLTGSAGILDNSRFDRVDSFEIVGDGVVLYASPVMHLGDQPAAFDLSISGVSDLELVVTSANHTKKGGKDCAIWADPMVYPVAPIVAAPPITDDQATPDSQGVDNSPAQQNGVYNWSDVPQNQDVTLKRAVFDESGYQLFDTQGDTIVVPYTDSTGSRNLYVMKFARSADNLFHFINSGNAPILYVPQGGYLDNATASGARWYPFPDSFYPSAPVYMGIAPDWSSYVGMGWYPGMCYYGGYYGYHSYHPGVVFFPLAQTVIVIGSERYHGWGQYHNYYEYHHAPYHTGYYHHENYEYVRQLHDDRPSFDRQRQFARWTGPHDALANERRNSSITRSQPPHMFQQPRNGGGPRDAFTNERRNSSIIPSQPPLIFQKQRNGIGTASQQGSAPLQGHDSPADTRNSWGNTVHPNNTPTNSVPRGWVHPNNAPTNSVPRGWVHPNNTTSNTPSQSWGHQNANTPANNQTFGGFRPNNPAPSTYNNQSSGQTNSANKGFNQPSRQNTQPTRSQSSKDNNKSSDGKNNKKGF